MRIAITGANGQLGSYLCKHFESQDVVPLTSKDMNFFEFIDIPAKITAIKPDIVINCAAYTDVDKAEGDTIGCYRINATAAAQLAGSCKHLGARFVQLSTDYVFNWDIDSLDDDKIAFAEYDEVQARGVYASSKDLAERLIKTTNSRAIVIRTCGLYITGRPNFYSTMLSMIDRPELTVVDDQICTPTYIPDLAEAISALIDIEHRHQGRRGATGLFHVTNSGRCSWRDFADEIFQIIHDRQDRKCPAVIPITTNDWVELNAKNNKRIAPRPAYSVLDCSKYEMKTGKKLRHWNDALRECITSEFPD